MSKQKQYTVKEWVIKEGDAKIAALLHLDKGAVRHWRLGWVLPSSRQWLKIKEASGGCVSIDLTIEKHFAPENKKNRFSK